MIKSALHLHLPLLAALALLVSACVRPVEYPAHQATPLGGVRLVPPHSDATAAHPHATGFTQPADALDFTVHAPDSGLYRLDLTYSAGTAKRIPILVNDNFQGSRLLPATSGFATHAFGRIHLDAGANTLRIGTDWGYADIASIRLAPVLPPRAFRLSAAPVNPRASPEARALFTTLTRDFGRRIYAGQHESDPSAPSRLAQVARLTEGAQPVLLGLDLIFYSPAWNHPDGDGALLHARDWALNHHGIVTLSWHWLAPLHPSPLVWDSFSTSKTAFDVSRVADESSAEHAAVLRDLDHLAEKLKLLRDARVPVLWRPLHEADGGWFWWGARGPDAAKRLYRLMFDRFTRVHGLDNLLWVWTTSDNDDARAWYPGDNYVDIVAADLYLPAGAQGDLAATFDRLRELYRGRKPIALGECGALPALSPRSPWLWFLVWDDFVSRPDFNPPAALSRAYSDPRVRTLPPKD